MSDDTKRIIVLETGSASRGRPSGQRPNRKQSVLFHETYDATEDEVFEDAEQFKQYEGDSPNSISAKLHDIGSLFVNAAKRNGNTQKQPKRDKEPASAITGAHPSRLLSDNKKAVYFKEGDSYVRQGYTNARMYRWMTVEGITGETTTFCGVTYNISVRKLINMIFQALIDRGANGCVFGNDCTLIGEPTNPRFVAITGLDNHQMPNVPIRNVGSLCVSNRGPVICIWNEVAYTGQNQSIVSATQLEAFHNRVDDRSLKAGGTQRITTVYGFVFPLSIIQGLPYFEMRPYTDQEYIDYPHVIMTSDKIWDPTIFDNTIDPNDPSFVKNTKNLLHLLPHDDYMTSKASICVPTARSITLLPGLLTLDFALMMIQAKPFSSITPLPRRLT